jgi:hypothetical protein
MNIKVPFLQRLVEGLTKHGAAQRLRTSEDAFHYWLSGRTIGRKASVERIKEFLEADCYPLLTIAFYCVLLNPISSSSFFFLDETSCRR